MTSNKDMLARFIRTSQPIYSFSKHGATLKLLCSLSLKSFGSMIPCVHQLVANFCLVLSRRCTVGL